MVEKIDTGRKGKTFSKINAVNPYTGEFKEILMIGAPEEFDRGFAKIFHAFTEALLKDDEIALGPIKLLFWVMKELELGSIEFYMYPPEVAKELGVTDRTIRNWRSKLIAKGLIKKIKPHIYMINPACVVRGKGHTLLEEFKNPKLPGLEEE